MAKISVGEAAINLLRDYGVDTVFGIPGVHTLEFYRGFGDQSQIRHVQARNELGAGFMADGYARSSGKPGVCLTISGPGVTNAATALGQAYADSQPVLLLSAEAATETLGKGRGALHEVTDLNAVTRPLTAFSECAESPDDVPGLIHRAFDFFASKRPRPIHIAIPLDILEELVKDDWKPQKLSKRVVADENQIKAAAARLRDAEFPLLMIGGGAVGADIKPLAEICGAIVLSSNAGKGIMPSDHPLDLSGMVCRPEALALLDECDLVVAIGTELGETDSFRETLNITAPLLRIDIDPGQMQNHYSAEIEIVGDAADAVERLVQAMHGHSVDASDKHQRVAAIRSATFANLSGSEPKHIILHKKLREAFPPETFIMADATQMTYSGSFMMPVDLPRRWNYAAGYCALGYAFPNAIGAKYANPDAPVVALAGDGGTMFTVQELITAAEMKLPIPLILWHNDGYKQIRDDMRGSNVPRIAVDGLAPDFATLARAMHCHAEEPGSLAAVSEAITKALSSDRPTVIIIREGAEWLDG